MRLDKMVTATVAALEDIKARDIVVLDVRRLTALFDKLIVASGESARQNKALADSVQEKLKALGTKIVGVEGRRNGEWVLVDLGDVVVHVMHPAVRSFYNLEELWGGKEVKLAKAKAAKPKKQAKPKRAPARGKTAPRRRRK